MDSIYKRYIPAIAPQNEDDDSAFMFIFSSGKILVKIAHDAPEIPEGRDLLNSGIDFSDKLYLGVLDGRPCCCMEADDKIAILDGMAFKDLRSLLGLLEEDIFLLAGRAFQIVNWNGMNKYCGRCGSLTQFKENERSKVCPECGSVFYPRISPAIIVAVTQGSRILLAHNRNFKQKRYSVIAGFVEPGETFEDCVKREVMEEVGIHVKDIKYFGSQPWPFPDSLMVGFTAEWDSGEICVDGVEIDDAGWFMKDGLPETPSKFSIAGRLIEQALSK